MTKAFEMIEQIETIRNALAPKYEFPYYALVRIQPTHGPCFHIPAPLFNGSAKKPRSVWAGNLPIAQDKRDGKYYECPFCGEKSFYAGVCQNCEGDYDILADHTDEWEVGCMPERYRLQNRENRMRRLQYENHKAVKTAVKEEFLRRLDSGLELGIISAEIVLPVAWGAEWKPSPFLKCSDYSALWALDRIEKEIYQEMIRNYTPEDGVPLDYLEGDVITVEGTNELRRHVDGFWQHKHPEDGYDYWHPMGRVHKENK